MESYCSCKKATAKVSKYYYMKHKTTRFSLDLQLYCKVNIINNINDS